MSLFPFIQNARKTESKTLPAKRRILSLSAGQVVSEDTSKQVSAFYRGLVFLSTQLAKLPVEVKDKNNNIKEDHIISTLLNVCPNEEMHAFSFKVALIQNAIIYGEGYAEIERNGRGDPMALHILDSKDVQPVRTTTGKLVYRIFGGTWSNSKKEDVYLPPNDIFVLKNFVASNGEVGQSVISYAKNVLGISLGADNLASGLYANGGIPSGILYSDGKLSDEAYERISASWKSSIGGKKTGGTAVLEEGLKYQSVSLDPNVLQVLDSRKFNVLEISRFLSVPPQRLYATESNTYANGEQAGIDVATDAIDAWSRNFESECDFKLLFKRRGGVRTELDLSALYRGDMATRGTFWQKMMQVSAISPNEIRKKEGMAPYEGGDRYFIATNNFYPSDRLDEKIDNDLKDKSQDSTANTDNPEEKAENEMVNALISKIINK